MFSTQEFRPNCIQYVTYDNMDHTVIQYSNGILVISEDFKTGKYYDGIQIDFEDFNHGNLNLADIDQDHIPLSVLKQQLFIPYIGWTEGSNGQYYFMTTFDWIPGVTCNSPGTYFIE